MSQSKKTIDDLYKLADHNHSLLHSVLEEQTKELKLIKKGLEKVMSAISDFADKMKVHNDHVDIAISGLQGDVAELNRQIAALQASQGQITPADQALLDEIEARAATIHDKLDALDALTPPAVPVVP